MLPKAVPVWKKTNNKYLTNLIFSVCTVSYGSSTRLFLFDLRSCYTSRFLTSSLNAIMLRQNCVKNRYRNMAHRPTFNENFAVATCYIARHWKKETFDQRNILNTLNTSSGASGIRFEKIWKFQTAWHLANLVPYTSVRHVLIVFLERFQIWKWFWTINTSCFCRFLW